jgi:hypothetical protein
VPLWSSSCHVPSVSTHCHKCFLFLRKFPLIIIVSANELISPSLRFRLYYSTRALPVTVPHDLQSVPLLDISKLSRVISKILIWSSSTNLPWKSQSLNLCLPALTCFKTRLRHSVRTQESGEEPAAHVARCRLLPAVAMVNGSRRSKFKHRPLQGYNSDAPKFSRLPIKCAYPSRTIFREHEMDETIFK